MVLRGNIRPFLPPPLRRRRRIVTHVPPYVLVPLVIPDVGLPRTRHSRPVSAALLPTFDHTSPSAYAYRFFTPARYAVHSCSFHFPTQALTDLLGFHLRLRLWTSFHSRAFRSVLQLTSLEYPPPLVALVASASVSPNARSSRISGLLSGTVPDQVRPVSLCDTLYAEHRRKDTVKGGTEYLVCGLESTQRLYHTSK
ncbi:hypothetical protein K488DRAFT_92422 [Vararia minispora EC-137]|uniref:Uncharacterized protein n=1 Tax=Vararia minispora EC-137 TaxID=1314806 RepID=A0ACB8Q4I7_9AGAM|nr:hypothetical protein K488DRAFT_92422 [Vararia minispora EC-137]